MRVLMTTDTVGGVWSYTKDLTEGLLGRGCSVTLMSMGRAPSAEQMNWAQEVKGRWPEGFEYVPTEFKLEWMQEGVDCFERSKGFVEDCARACGADLLHSNQFCYGALDLALPKIVVGHSDVRSWWAACRGGEPEASLWSETYGRTVTQGLRDADVVVAPTRWMAEQLRTHYGVAGEVRVIANGRSGASPGHSARNEGPRRMQAITCGRLWDEGKNLRLLDDVDGDVDGDVHVDFAMPILVAGETEFEAGCEVPRSVRFLGALSETELRDQFGKCALYLVTSKYEPFGLAAVEAALAGCALVVNDTSSQREVWGDAAVYFERNSAHSLARVLRELSRDEERVQRMAEAAESRARSLYSADRMTEKYMEVYGELLAGRSYRHVA